jgi:hypothetical protein
MTVCLWATSLVQASELVLRFPARREVPDLVCPPERTAPPRRGSPPVGAPATVELPDAADLEALPALASVPQAPLPEAVLRGFAPPGTARSKPLRVGLWGDSHLAAGFVGDALTEALRQRGLRVGTGFLSMALTRPGVRSGLRKACVASTWQFEPAYRARTAVLAVGPDLARLTTRKAGAWLWLDLRDEARRPRLSAVELYYQTGPRGAGILVGVDDARARPLRLTPRRTGEMPRRLRIEAKSLSLLKLRVVTGEVSLLGLRLVPLVVPDVELDLLAYPSATSEGWARAETAVLTSILGATPYAAAVLAYGTNEANVSPFVPEHYAERLKTALRRMRRVLPDAACLLVAPTDRGRRLPPRSREASQELRSATLLQYARIHQTVTDTQARLGAEVGCAVWRWQAYMGGQGSIYRWARETPPLAAPDLIHLTVAGYRRSGAELARVLGWDVTPATRIPFEPVSP